ncbi:MAG: hypothetical protein IKP54_09295 [Bacteroidales bacterium]|nr:hypothetical protein [Bacteroidales bacterium]
MAYAQCNQDTVAIGDGNSYLSSAYLPVNTYYNYSLTETIIDAAELGNPMILNRISYFLSTSTAMTHASDVRIYLMPTDKKVFSSNSDIVPIDANSVLVYSGSLNCSQGWNTFNFTTPYQYDGSTNLLVIVHDNASGYDGSSFKFAYTNCTGRKALALYSNNINPNPESTTFSDNRAFYSYRPVMRLNGCIDTRSCHKPFDLTYSGLAWDSCFLSWRDTNASGTTFKVYRNNILVASGLTDTSYTLTGLSAISSYNIAVTANCDSSSESFPVRTFFKTPCGPVTLPYSCGFETNEIAQYTGTGGLELPLCWDRFNNASTYNSYPYVASSFPTHTGNNSLYFFMNSGSTYGDTVIAILPAIDPILNPMTNNMVRIWANTTSPFTVELGTIGNIDDASSFVPLDILSLSGNGYAEYEGFLHGASNTADRAALRLTKIPDTTVSVYFDDLVFEHTPSCIKPQDLTASANSNSITLNWENNTDTSVIRS